MNFIPYLLFFVGFIFIVKGGDYFVDAATWMARITGLPEVFIGATIVSLATTLPETSVSVLSVVRQQPSMAIGNAIGSTICNTGFVLAVYNIIRPIKVQSRIFTLKGLLMITYIFILWIISFNGTIDRLSSLLLLFLLTVYIVFDVFIIQYRKTQNSKMSFISVAKKKEIMENVLKFAVGITLILVGANFLVKYGVILARFWGVPTRIISLTLIALGTSLPELVTAISALIKGHSAISVGNIIGANILNITMVIGFSAQIRPLHVLSQTYYLDMPVSLILNSLLVLPSIFTKKISRLQAFVLFVGYCVYTVILLRLSH
jgi:cation:H+ antiporter